MVDPNASTNRFGPQAPPVLILELVDGVGPGEAGRPDDSGILLVGRAGDTQLRVEDRHVSRHHFLLELRPSGCVVVDLGSANGTVLNGERVAGEAAVRDGDELEAGASRFRVRLEAPAPPPERPRQVVVDAPADQRQRRVRCRECARVVVVERATVLVDDAGHIVAHAEHDSDFLCRDCRKSDRDLPDAQFPGYRTVEAIGEGSMGSVYLVERDLDGQLFALKRMHPDAPLEGPEVQRFLREAAALAALRHRNIVGFVDQGYVEGDFFFLMEYVEGVDLDLYRRQAGGRVPMERCVGLVSQVLDGLDYAHRQGFVHRDVKPANILVGVIDGLMTPKITDFGLAKRYEEAAQSAITRGHISFGTPDYMPPEQITRFRDIDPRADLYSVGATLYHLISGVTLYHGIGGQDPIRTLLEVDPPLLARRGAWLPQPICDVVDKAVRRKPEERWPTAAVFRDALLQALRLS